MRGSSICWIELVMLEMEVIIFTPTAKSIVTCCILINFSLGPGLMYHSWLGLRTTGCTLLRRSLRGVVSRRSPKVFSSSLPKGTHSTVGLNQGTQESGITWSSSGAQGLGIGFFFFFCFLRRVGHYVGQDGLELRCLKCPPASASQVAKTPCLYDDFAWMDKSTLNWAWVAET